jgi:hypothetical protein
VIQLAVAAVRDAQLPHKEVVMSTSRIWSLEPRRANRALAPVAAALLGLGVASAALPAKADHGTALCPGAFLQSAGRVAVQTAGAGTLLSVLDPGDSVPTSGTDLVDSPQLAGELVVDEIQTFSFMTSGGIVSGVLQQRVVDAGGTCHCYWRVQLTPNSAPAVRVNRLHITGFKHPQANLLADFRNDILPLGIGSTRAQRSAAPGNTITFKFEPGIGAGQASQAVFLTTQADSVTTFGGAQVRTDNGASSLKFYTYVPD